MTLIEAEWLEGERQDASTREGRFDVVHSDALRFFPELVRECGGDPDALYAEARMHPDAARHGGPLLEYSDFVRLLALAAERLGVQDFGLRLAQSQRGGKVIGPIGVVMKNSKTVGQAVGYCAKHIQAYSLATRVRFKPNRSRHILLVSLEVLLDGVFDTRQVMEHALSLANLNIIDISRGGARARQVLFRHEPTLPLKDYRSHFGCEVLFGQETDGFVLTEDDLLCEIADPDEQIFEMATDYIDHHYPPSTPPIHARVRALVLRYLGSEDYTHERVAAELCMHPRTLQRRLRAEGMSFESIKDEVRREVALRYLQQSDLPLVRVAQKLGYAETSVLSRSCQRWFDASPQQLRRAGGAPAVGK
ncbi:MAG: helix-turn-helix transcriptional regulator [Hyphomonadaceae bacterium]|nr:helix-turn-helix transcriptional regulator [Hyphomonadaceae bacterium]GIK47929.1 MAG: putative transcriptional regulatory protein [Alphaproteobacteria bacterium]